MLAQQHSPNVVAQTPPMVETQQPVGQPMKVAATVIGSGSAAAHILFEMVEAAQQVPEGELVQVPDVALGEPLQVVGEVERMGCWPRHRIKTKRGVVEQPTVRQANHVRRISSGTPFKGSIAPLVAQGQFVEMIQMGRPETKIAPAVAGQ